MDKFRQAIDRLSLREQRMLYLVCAVLIAVLMKFMVLGSIRNIFSLRGQTSTIRETIAQKERLLQEFAAVRAPAATSNPNWNYYKENIGLSGILRKISSKDDSGGGFRVVKIASEKTEKVNDYEKTSLKLEIEAPFNLIGTFLEDLENSKLLTRVEGVEVSRIENELRLCNAKISLNSFAWREK